MPTNDSNPDENKDTFLLQVTNCFNQNINRSKTGYRYTEEMRLFAAYVRMISGRLAYETFKANTQHSVPSLSSVDRYIAKVNSNVVEGELRSSELLEYLTALKLPKVVALSEDATRITNIVQYDRQNNQLVGFVLPLGENGMPIVGYNTAKSAVEIESCFYDLHTGQEKKYASYLNVVMAQPLVAGFPAFCLLLFGSDSKYTSTDIEKRWQFIINELKKKGIEVVTFASDSDPKFNAVMRRHLDLGQKTEYNMNFPEWFCANLCFATQFAPIQDSVHIGTKCRNGMLTHTLKMREFDVTVEHLELVMTSFTKEQHNLCETTIKPKDKQNFESVLKICDEKVLDLLSKFEGSAGTILYLRVVSNILQSFLDIRLAPIERVRKIFFSVFVLRIWRKFIIESKNKYTLANNFISHNCYSCVEINAHSLVFLILNLKERKLDHLFQSQLLGSQQCESIFRQIRSFTSTYSTVTNCSLLEIIRRISKIELQNEITHIKLKHYNFPRLGLPSSSYYPRKDRNGLIHIDNFVPLPSQQEIIKEIEMAKLEAIEYAESVGMYLRSPDGYKCTFPKLKAHNSTKVLLIPPIIPQSEVPPIIPQCEDVLQRLRDVDLKPYAIKVDPNTVSETSPYVKVKNKNGELLCIEKHTLCWLLGKSTTKLSSNRLRRVMHPTS